ncbi:MAG TPA: hypothetical protein VLG67_01120 [Candidatus Saccharimonadales bacterium]|nr:hypothetical protein [Candidatus Saccharimonadales bacterium]
MDNIDFSDFFQTKSGASDFTNRLFIVAEDVFKSDFDLEKTLMSQLGIQKKDKLMNILRDANVPIESQSALKDFLTKLIEHITSLPVFSLKLAFEPQEQTLKKISEWFIVNAKKQVLLDITIDRNLIAGASISFNGEYKNFSIKPKFEAVLNEILIKRQEKTVTNQSSQPITNINSPIPNQ